MPTRGLGHPLVPGGPVGLLCYGRILSPAHRAQASAAGVPAVRRADSVRERTGVGASLSLPGRATTGSAELAGLLEELGGPPARGGVVHIVGGGPGDPACLSLRAARLLATCDVVAYDYLSPAEALDLVPDSADRLLVGRRRGRPGYEREDLDDLLLARAAAGDAVVRLKGGDPFVFGRGGEEAQACVEAGLPFEVVHGVTSPVAVPGAAGIPVTHRGVSRGVAVVTGHEALPEDDDGSADALAVFPGTLIVLMGLARLRSLAGRLIAHGRSPATPAAVVAAGTLPTQRSVRATLATIADVAEEHGITTPAVVVVGDVAALEPVLPAREQRPLHGRRVLLPRSSRRGSRLTAALRHAGAEVLPIQVAREVDGDAAAVARLAADVIAGRITRLLVGDAKGTTHLRDALLELGADLRALAGVEVCASDERAADRLVAQVGVRPDRVLADTTAWAEALAGDTTASLITDGQMETVRTALGDAVDTRPVVTSRLEPVPVHEVPDADVAVAPAARLVAPLLECLGEREVPVVALGPATETALAHSGRAAAATAAEPTPEALVTALTTLWGPTRG